MLPRRSMETRRRNLQDLASMEHSFAGFPTRVPSSGWEGSGTSDVHRVRSMEDPPTRRPDHLIGMEGRSRADLRTDHQSEPRNGDHNGALQIPYVMKKVTLMTNSQRGRPTVVGVVVGTAAGQYAGVIQTPKQSRRWRCLQRPVPQRACGLRFDNCPLPRPPPFSPHIFSILIGV